MNIAPVWFFKAICIFQDYIAVAEDNYVSPEKDTAVLKSGNKCCAHALAHFEVGTF